MIKYLKLFFMVASFLAWEGALLYLVSLNYEKGQIFSSIFGLALVCFSDYMFLDIFENRE